MKNKPILKRVSLLLLMLCSATFAFAQISISGKVTDESKESIIGANVKVKDGKTGTITDVDGKFKISVPNQSAILVVSYVGYATKEMPIGKNRVLEVVLKEDGIALDEVVAIGYGNVKKSDLTGSVAKVDMNELNKSQVLSFDQALGGRVAGVHVVSGDGRPGSEANIVIRGSNTISDSSDGSPLYVIDGFATEDANAASYNPNDIESIDVLKDASATAIYGARGANGVIIITTKRGKDSPPRVTYDGYVTYQLKPTFLKTLNGKQFVSLQEELSNKDMMNKTYYAYDKNLGRNRTLADYDHIPYTDWQEEAFRNAPMTSHHLALTGGSRNTRYSSSLSYYNQEGIIVNSSYESIKARLTLDQQITKSLKFGAGLNFANNVSNGSSPSLSGAGGTQYFLYQVLAFRPLDYSEFAEDEISMENPNYPYNPLLTMKNMYSKSTSRTWNLNAYLNWDIMAGLTLRATFSYNTRLDRNESYNSSETYWGDPRYSALRSNGSFSYREQMGWANEYTLTYKKKVKTHNFMGMVGASMNSQQTSVLGAKSGMVPWDELGFWGIDTGTPVSLTADNMKYNMFSYFGRFNYDWRSRYLVTATMRADGTSKFPYHKWGYFPSASFAWRISDEAFMRNTTSWLSNLKFRAGWGATGNNGTQVPYPSQRLYAGNESYAFNNSLSPAVYAMQLANKDLKWETTYQTNLGLDFGFLNNRISGEIDIYNKDTKDLLLYAEVPLSIGFSEVQQNVGSITNKGLEISLNTVNFTGGSRKRLKWTTNFNISFNRNEVTALSGQQDSRTVTFKSPAISNLYICKVGRPLSEMYGYVYDGVYQYADFNEIAPGVFSLKDGIPNNTQERANIQPGDMKLRDINGDGKVTAEDQTVIGHGLPIHTGGFTNNFEWKGFDLSVFFQWSYGNDVINYTRKTLEELRAAHSNQLVTALNHWTPRINNGDGTYTDGNYTNYLCAVNRSLGNLNTSRVVEDGSFLRLKNVQLGYNFAPRLVKKMRLSTLRMYVSGQNLWVWSKYSGYDPEVSTRNSSMSRGFDYSSYPRTASYTLGIKAGF